MSARRARRELLDSERPPDRELRRPPRPTLRPARRGSRPGLDGDIGRGARDECRAARAVYVRRTPELGVRCSVGSCRRAALAISLPLRQLRQAGQTLGHSIVCLTSVFFPLVVLNSLVLNFESTDMLQIIPIQYFIWFMYCRPRSPLYSLSGHSERVLDVDWSAPQLLATASADSTLKLFAAPGEFI